MRYMLDTNICIYAIKKKPAQVLERLLEHDVDEICISAVTYAELMHGVEKSQSVMRNKLALNLFLANIEILDFDTFAADEYGSIRAELEKRGQVIGIQDMLIAGHAKSKGCVLVTNNTREFERVEGLELENWTN